MNNSLVSVIIPIYDVEKHLNRCVESVVNQTYKNLEIILVDDGSPDKCPEICDEWAMKDSRIKVIHKENGGISSARNAGLEVCSGEYIAFVDSDDWIELEMYSILIKAIKDNCAEMAIAGRYDVFESTDLKISGRCPEVCGVYLPNEILPKMLLGQHYDSAVWDKLYHSSLWKVIRFPNGKIYEDVAIMYKVVLSCKKIVTVTNLLYNYYHREDSIVTSKFREALFDYPDNTRKMLDDIKVQCPECEFQAKWAYFKALQHVLIKLLKADDESFNNFKVEYIQLSKELKLICASLSKKIISRIDKLICELLSVRFVARLVFKLKKIISH